MNKQFKDLLELYIKYIDIFNNWTNDRETLKDYERLVNIYLWLTDILLDNNIIEKHGIKKYKVVESGEII
jgi:hypothetical protein